VNQAKEQFGLLAKELGVELKEDLLSYRRNRAAKFLKDTNQILAVVEVAKVLAANILTAHKNASFK